MHHRHHNLGDPSCDHHYSCHCWLHNKQKVLASSACEKVKLINTVTFALCVCKNSMWLMWCASKFVWVWFHRLGKGRQTHLHPCCTCACQDNNIVRVARHYNDMIL